MKNFKGMALAQMVRYRYEANMKIVDILKGMAISQQYKWLPEKFKEWAEGFRDGRAGQIICNYCDDYRCGHPSAETVDIMNALFPEWYTYDPFFEESVETLNRLTAK